MNTCAIPLRPPTTTTTVPAGKCLDTFHLVSVGEEKSSAEEGGKYPRDVSRPVKSGVRGHRVAAEGVMSGVKWSRRGRCSAC